MISVIVPVYNTETYLDQCIKSILCQEYKDFELLLIDDGSTDSSYEICASFERTDERVRVIRQENQGQGAARNTGIENSRGEYITFVDSDDWIEPQLLKLLYENLKKYDADISCCLTYSSEDKTDFNAEDACIVKNTQEAMSLFAYNKDGFNHSPVAKLFKREVIAENRFLVLRGFEDAGTVFKFFINAKKVVSQKISLYFYYQRCDSTMHRKFGGHEFDRIRAFKEMEYSLYKDGRFMDAARAATQGKLGAIYHFSGELMNSDIPDKHEWKKRVQAECTEALKNYKRNSIKDVVLLLMICTVPDIFAFIYMQKVGKRW